jgi:hypothetical protein
MDDIVQGEVYLQVVKNLVVGACTRICQCNRTSSVKKEREKAINWHVWTAKYLRFAK